jgi:hypothetical protein
MIAKKKEEYSIDNRFSVKFQVDEPICDCGHVALQQRLDEQKNMHKSHVRILFFLCICSLYIYESKITLHAITYPTDFAKS